MGPVWIARCPPSWSPADAQADMDCLHKVPAQVRPAAAPLHIRQAIAALAAVRLQISLEAFEEVRRMEPCGGCLLLGLIEKAELSFHVFRLFTGCAEEFFRLVFRDFHLLGENRRCCQKAWGGGISRSFSDGLNALGCSISSPDMSQSNCFQETPLASWEFLGHRKRPCASILL